MLISDWSSDVCDSCLIPRPALPPVPAGPLPGGRAGPYRSACEMACSWASPIAMGVVGRPSTAPARPDRRAGDGAGEHLPAKRLGDRARIVRVHEDDAGAARK